MGYTFAAALVKKTGAPGKNPTAPATRKAIREGLESMGYVKAADAENASLVLPLHHDKKSAWLTVALEMPEDLDAQTELLRQLSAEMHTPILYFMNLDSDFLYMAATDGAKVQHVHVGFDEDDDAMTDSEDLSVFDALLPDDAARAEFRRILAVDDEERVFSESAAQEMAALFGYTAEALFVDEDAEPFAVLAFETEEDQGSTPKNRLDIPLLVPENEPPVLRWGGSFEVGGGNPCGISIRSHGGVSKGIRVILRAVGYDAHDWELPVLWLRGEQPGGYSEKVVPGRCRFEDGAEGWIAEFPDAPIYQGVNPEPAAANSHEAHLYHCAHELVLKIAFCGGTFRLTEPKKPTDPDESLTDWNWKRREYYHCGTGETDIWIIPMENPEHGFHKKQDRAPFSCELNTDWLRGYWPDDKL